MVWINSLSSLSSLNVLTYKTVYLIDEFFCRGLKFGNIEGLIARGVKRLSYLKTRWMGPTLVGRRAGRSGVAGVSGGNAVRQGEARPTRVDKIPDDDVGHNEPPYWRLRPSYANTLSTPYSIITSTC